MRDRYGPGSSVGMRKPRRFPSLRTEPSIPAESNETWLDLTDRIRATFNRTKRVIVTKVDRRHDD